MNVALSMYLMAGVLGKDTRRIQLKTTANPKIRSEYTRRFLIEFKKKMK